MNKTPIKQVVKDLIQLFNVNTKHEFGTSELDGKFMIDKRQFNRMEVLHELQGYFKDKIIEGGYLKVDSLTFVFTTFEVIKGKP